MKPQQYKSSSSLTFHKIDARRNFTTRQESRRLSGCTLIEKRLQHWRSPMKSVKSSRTPFSTESTVAASNSNSNKITTTTTKIYINLTGRIPQEFLGRLSVPVRFSISLTRKFLLVTMFKKFNVYTVVAKPRRKFFSRTLQLPTFIGELLVFM